MAEFDQFADDYRDIHSKNIECTGQDSRYFSEFKVKEIKRVFKKRTFDAILDFGCGDGITVECFREHFSSPITGIDVSEASIEAAKKRNIPHSVFTAYDGHKIPFADQSFDLVYTACVFHHIPSADHVGLLQECRRVLKKGGLLVIFEHNPYNPVTRHIVNTCVFDKDAILIPPGKFSANMKKGGFNRVRTRHVLFMPRWKFLTFLLPLERLFFFIPLGGQYYVWSEK